MHRLSTIAPSAVVPLKAIHRPAFSGLGLNELSKTLPLIEDQERFAELVERQKELALRMQSLADAEISDRANLE